VRRRTLLAGLGSLAVGSGAVLGSGAVTSITADRAVEIGVAGDASAFLQLTDQASSDLVDTNNSQVRIRLDSSSPGSGTGVNVGGGGSPALTAIDPAFRITNAGDQPLYVEIDHGAIGTSSSENDVQFIAKDNGGFLTGTTPAFIDRDSTSAVSTSIAGGGTVSNAGAVALPVSEYVDVAIQVASGSSASTTSSLLDSATIEAYTTTGPLTNTTVIS
jgi:hypothetical protein